MKPRAKGIIEEQIKRSEKDLADIIDASLYYEKHCAEDIKYQEERLKEMRAEVSFEDTFEGKVEKFEKIAFAKIEAIVEELSSVTGRDYLLQEALTEIYRNKGGK